MTSEVEERPRLVTGGYGRHRRQWVNEQDWNLVNMVLAVKFVSGKQKCF